MVEQKKTVIYLTDRSAEDLDDRCGQAYLWNRLYDKIGIVSVEESANLIDGIDIHNDLATIASLKDISREAIDALLREITGSISRDQWVYTEGMETLYRRLGWMAAFALYIEPRIRRDFETIDIESELLLDRDPLFVGVTPDRLLNHRVGEYLVYREYKTTISASSKWLASWNYEPQLHIGIAAIQEEYGLPIAYAQIMGLMKGDRRGERLSHPYVWAWRNSETGEWTNDYNKARSANWGPAPVWEYPGGVVSWVELCGEGVALAQFPHTPPVFLNERLLDDWVTRRTARHEEIYQIGQDSLTDEDLRTVYFERRTKNCAPAFGDACQYRAACWNQAVNSDPLASGLYKRRVPHHSIELAMMKDAEKP